MLCICGRVVVFGCIFVTSIYAVSCPKGSFISPSGCQPCPEGEYSDSVNSTKCSKCDLCRGKHNRLTQPCNSTSNTKCSCEPGYFWDVFLFCLKCHRCKRGHGVVKNCTSLRNTVCGVCEHGTNYSNKKDFSPCKPCTTCPHGYWVEKKCNKKNDTVCRKDTDMNGSKNDRNRGRSSGAIQQGNPDTKLPDDNHTPSPTNNSTNATAKPHQPSQQKVLEPQPNTGSDSELVIALAVLSGVAFLVMLIAMALLLRNKCTRKSAKHTDEAEKVEDSSNSVSEVEGARENPYTSLPLIGARQETMLRDTPYTLISDLAKHLNPGCRWKELGGRLDFNNTEISNFAIERQNSTQAMLEEWGQRDCATVVALQKVLHSLKWTKEERICAEYV